MNSEDLQEKQKKAGHPLFILIIFVALLGFLFFIPEIYKKYNTEIADFLGIGNKNDDPTNNEEDGRSTVSAYYQIGSKSTLKFNEIELTDITLSDDKKTLSFNVKTEDIFELDEANYYLEFFQNRKKFIGRRALHGRITKSLPLKIDVSNLNIDTTTYFVVSHIADNAITPSEIESDESGLSSLTCVKENYSYTYEFYLKKLTKVTKKYTYQDSDINNYAQKLLELQKLEKDYNNYTGVTASIVENANTILFLANFDYSEVKTFSRLNDSNIFAKDTSNTIVKFKMDAEGYECS